MSLSLKAKLTALISLLVLVVVVATSAWYVSALIRFTLVSARSQAIDEAQRLISQSAVVLNQARLPAGMNPENPEELRSFASQTLNNDPQLVSFIGSAQAFSEYFEYVALTASNGDVILHNDPQQVRHVLPRTAPFAELADDGLYEHLKMIYGKRIRIFEVSLPATFGSESMTARIGVSTILLKSKLGPEINKALEKSAVVVLLATLTAGVLSLVVLGPLKSISLNVDQLARGELPSPVAVSRTDEWGILASKLNLLGERIRGEKAAFVALQENLDQMLANLADGLMFFDQQDRLVLATPVVQRFLSKPVDQILRQTPAEIFCADDQIHQRLRAAFAERKPINAQTVEGMEGSETDRVAVSVAFVEEEGSPVASLVTLRDAGMRAEFESQIDMAAKLAALGRLTAGVAHEVRNPLNAMVLQIEVLKAKLGDQARAVMPHLDILGSEVRRLDRVVRTFLDFTRPVELRPAETDLAALVEEVFRTAEPEAGRHRVRLVFEGNGGARARVDRDLMKQVLLNLVLNGCQAMPSGGELKVSAREHRHQVEIEVADQGVGIPAEARARIFSLYYTTKPSGTGVGLAMSFRIVQLHNGSIDFSSEVQRGTTFRLTLPR
jgi:signal transduction histidine kinase